MVKEQVKGMVKGMAKGMVQGMVQGMVKEMVKGIDKGMVQGMAQGMVKEQLKEMVQRIVKGICAHRSQGKAGSQISLSSFYNMQMHLLTGIVYLSICTTLIRLPYLKLLFPPQEIINVSVFAQMFCRVFSLIEWAVAPKITQQLPGLLMCWAELWMPVSNGTFPQHFQILCNRIFQSSQICEIGGGQQLFRLHNRDIFEGQEEAKQQHWSCFVFLPLHPAQIPNLLLVPSICHFASVVLLSPVALGAAELWPQAKALQHILCAQVPGTGVFRGWGVKRQNCSGRFLLLSTPIRVARNSSSSWKSSCHGRDCFHLSLSVQSGGRGQGATVIYTL